MKPSLSSSVRIFLFSVLSFSLFSCSQQYSIATDGFSSDGFTPFPEQQPSIDYPSIPPVIPHEVSPTPTPAVANTTQIQYCGDITDAMSTDYFNSITNNLGIRNMISGLKGFESSFDAEMAASKARDDGSYRKPYAHTNDEDYLKNSEFIYRRLTNENSAGTVATVRGIYPTRYYVSDQAVFEVERTIENPAPFDAYKVQHVSVRAVSPVTPVGNSAHCIISMNSLALNIRSATTLESLDQTWGYIPILVYSSHQKFLDAKATIGLNTEASIHARDTPVTEAETVIDVCANFQPYFDIEKPSGAEAKSHESYIDPDNVNCNPTHPDFIGRVNGTFRGGFPMNPSGYNTVFYEFSLRD